MRSPPSQSSRCFWKISSALLRFGVENEVGGANHESVMGGRSLEPKIGGTDHPEVVADVGVDRQVGRILHVVCSLVRFNK